MRYTLSIVAAMLCVQPAVAQGWKPDKPVEIIVTCQPGCGPDGTARLIQKIWHQSDEFMAGAELDRALDGLYVQLKALLTDLELAKPGK